MHVFFGRKMAMGIISYHKEGNRDGDHHKEEGLWQTTKA